MVTTKEIIVWQCPECKDVVISNNWDGHEINFCECGKNGCDMEEHYVRWLGCCSVLARKAKRYDLDDLLKVATTSKKRKVSKRKHL